MGSGFPVLLVDDGELEDVRDVLNEARINFAHLRGGAVPSPLPPPGRLFISNARHARLARSWPDPRSPVRIAVVDEDSVELRQALRDFGYQYLVRRPAHPVALRLLVFRALYRGEERRSEPRVAMGYEVRVRSRMRRRDAWLADLSRGGCSLLADRPMSAGSRVTLQLPAHLDGEAEDLCLTGKVLRSSRLARARDQHYLVSVRFGEVGAASLARLDAALASALLHAPEPEVFLEDVASEPSLREVDGGVPEVAADDLEETTKDRRNNRRGQYDRRVIASVRDAMHRILIGRDLSAGGMRIEPHADLRLGDQLRVAVYDAKRDAPLVVEAIVERDDGPEGLLLRFDEVEPIVANQLEALVATLPPVECLEDGESAAMGTVVSEILTRED